MTLTENSSQNDGLNALRSTQSIVQYNICIKTILNGDSSVNHFKWTRCKMSNYCASFFLSVASKCVKWIEQSFTSRAFCKLCYEKLPLFSILTESLWSNSKPVELQIFGTVNKKINNTHGSALIYSIFRWDVKKVFFCLDSILTAKRQRISCV